MADDGDGTRISVVVVKNKVPDSTQARYVQEFEESLGSSLKRLGTLQETIRKTACCCAGRLRNDYVFFCNKCSSFPTEEYEILGLSCNLRELEETAEVCNLVVPIVHVPGLIPRSADRHWCFKKLQEHIQFDRDIDPEDETAKYSYRIRHNKLFDIDDKYTGTVFNSAQIQLLTATYLNIRYRRYIRSKKEVDIKLSKKVFHTHSYKEAFMLHDTEQSAALAREWTLINPPLTKIRNYLGEKIAFALAWRDCWIRWGLSLPAAFGLICIIYATIATLLEVVDLQGGDDQQESGKTRKRRNSSTIGTDTIDIINGTNTTIPIYVQGAFTEYLISTLDNTLVPYYALFMCLWTAVYVIKWQSLAKTLQFEWGMSGYTLQDEHERPGYKGTPLDHVFENKELADSQKIKCFRLLRRLTSLLIVLLLIIMVVLAFLLSLFVKFKLREILEPDAQVEGTSYWIFDATLISQIASGSTNAFCIIILRQIFNRVSYRLTIFEDHVFETDFERSLTWKLFAMDFLNTHFYNIIVLFFRNIFEGDPVPVDNDTDNSSPAPGVGIFGIPSERCDLCMHEDCMATVAINVFMIIIVQGLVMPIITWIYFQIRMVDKTRIRARGNDDKLTPNENLDPAHHDILKQIQKEYYYVDETLSGDTNSRYDRDYGTLLFMLKKMQLYSVVVMYAAACPLAPLLLVGFELGNHYRDRRKYTGGHHYRRPAAQRSDGIGHWLSIQHLINMLGVITNAVIIAMNSSKGKELFGVSWGDYYHVNIGSSSHCDPCGKFVKVKEIGLWILTVILIVTLAITTQFISTYFDFVPLHLKIAMRREKYEVNKKLKREKNQELACGSMTSSV